MTREQIIAEVQEAKVIVILRGLNTEQLVRTVDAMEKGGIRLVEIGLRQQQLIFNGCSLITQRF